MSKLESIEVPASAEELALIDERIREHEADPDDVVPWEEVRAELWPGLDGAMNPGRIQRYDES
jgi:hypothetical protein